MIADYRLGESGLPVLLVHCMLGRARDLGGLVAALKTPLDARAFDLPGHGASGPWDEATGYHDLCTTLAQARLPDGGVIIGHSFGATVALRLAVDNPGTLRALVLIEPVLFAAARGSAEAAEQAPHDDALAEAFSQSDMATAAAGFLAQWGAGPPYAAMPRDAQARIAARMPMVMATGADLHADRAGLLRPGVLENCTLPVLLLRGTASPAVTRAINRALAQRLPNARSSEIAGAGHMLPLTHATQTANAIDNFLGDLPIP